MSKKQGAYTFEELITLVQSAAENWFTPHELTVLAMLITRARESEATMAQLRKENPKDQRR